MELVHIAVAVAVIVLLILAGKIDPVISMIIGALYLGVTTGGGWEPAISNIVDGFAEIMGEVGLLIGFGVLIGSIMTATGTVQRVVNGLLRLIGVKRIPYVLGVLLTSLFPSIYSDVQFVLAAPLARQTAPKIGRYGLGSMGGTVTAGVLVGNLLVVPGLGAVAVAGVLKVPLGTMLIAGLVVGVLTTFISLLLWHLMLRCGFWNPQKDEAQPDAATADDPIEADQDASATRLPPFAVLLLPIALPLILIASGSIAGLFGAESMTLQIIGDPNVALFVGLLSAYAISRIWLGRGRTAAALSEGFNTMGQILILTGVGGSLGAAVAATGVDEILKGVFTAESTTSTVVAVLMVWVVAAVLHLAIGSTSISAIATAGIMAPIVGSLDVAPTVIALAIASGALFGVHVSSNGFWMVQSLLGTSTRGTLKVMTVMTSLVSVVALPIVLAISFVF